MTIDTDAVVSVTEANQNFSGATRIAEQKEQAVSFEDDRHKYLPIDLDSSSVVDMTDDEKIDCVASRILNRYKRAFEELAK